MLLTVLQASAQSLSKLEYWFDSHVSSRRSIALSGDEDYVSQNLSTDGLSVGLHWLNMRTVDTHGVYSGITTSPFLKSDPAVGGRLEYWFDDNYDHRHSIAADATSGLDTKLDLHQLSDFPLGVHRLNFRLIAANGQYTPISTAYVLRLGGGEPAWLEYWLDDDQANSRLTEGSPSGDGSYAIVADLDLNEAAPGFHRLYYRAASQSTHTASAVSMTPIMVKSMYNPETADLKVTGIRYWVDEGEAVESDVLSPASTVEITRHPDVRKMSAGTHAIKFQARNSASLWSEVQQADFELLALDAPQLTLEAQKDAEGLVTFAFNAIPNDLNYKVLRYNGTSTTHAVTVEAFGKAGKRYTFTGVDTPAVGSYTYEVLAKYSNAQGETETLRSNRISLTIDQAAQHRGVVYGRVTFSNLPTGQLPKGEPKTVRFSDGVEVMTDAEGKYVRNGLHFGQELTVTVPSDGFYDYDVLTVKPLEEVKNGKVMAVINGTLREGLPADLTFDEPTYDLYVNSTFQITPERMMVFRVKNNTDAPWSGYISVDAEHISQSLSVEALEQMKQVFYWFNKNDKAQKHYTFAKGEEIRVEIPMDDIQRFANIQQNDQIAYDLYFHYKKDGDILWSNLGVNEAYGLTNPTSMLIEGTMLHYTDKEIEYMIDEIIKIVKQAKTANKYLKYGYQIDDVLADYGQTDAQLEGEFLKAISKGLKDVLKVINPAMKPLEIVSKYYKECDEYSALKDAKTPMEQYFAYTKYIWDHVSKYSSGTYGTYANFYGKVLATYTEVAEALAERALDFNNYTSDYNICECFKNVDSRRVTIGFHDHQLDDPIELQQCDLNKIIRSATLEIYDPSPSRRNRHMTSRLEVPVTLTVNKGTINVKCDMANTGSYGYILSIVWTNGRVSKIPIVQKSGFSGATPGIQMSLEGKSDDYIHIEYRTQIRIMNKHFADFLRLEDKKQ